jgi:hypothetical protein
MGILGQPGTISEVSNLLFPKVEGYHEWLAIEETGAHIEYLAQRGYLSIDNIDQIENQESIPIRYRCQENISEPSMVPGIFLTEYARRDEKVN